ncbi:Agglutinin receptor [Dissostichus eleginoides]|uniref:Agglutinin receptor n=1 Tax=Dissostichus eleginoides TaxID=100907 RepID=A0AAD9F395_DISEL|nr:Agglutinin receptor [Dissostichus eleginoides]
MQQPNSNSDADCVKRLRPQSTTASQTDLEVIRPGNEKKAEATTQKTLEEQAGKHSEVQEALRCEHEELKAKLCTSEALKERHEVIVEEELQKIKASNLTLIELQKLNAETMAVLERAEEEKSSLKQMLKKEDIAQR